MKALLPQRFFSEGDVVWPLSEDQKNALSTFRSKLNVGVYNFESVRSPYGDQSILLACRDRYSLPVNTHLCFASGLLWTSPRMTTDSLALFYEADYRPIYVGKGAPPESFFQDQAEKGEQVLEFLAPYLPDTRKVFDIGCGAGGMLLPFKQMGFDVFGCDIGSNYLERGKKEGLILEHGDATSLEKYGPADVIILSHVLEHLPNPIESIRQLQRLLNENGLLYVEVPGIFSIHTVYGDFLRFLQNAHLYHFTLRSLSKMMANTGFTLVHGNEHIQAVYRNTGTSTDPKGTPWIKILSYLYWTEIRRRGLHAKATLRAGSKRVLNLTFGEGAKQSLKQLVDKSV